MILKKEKEIQQDGRRPFWLRFLSCCILIVIHAIKQSGGLFLSRDGRTYESALQ